MKNRQAKDWWSTTFGDPISWVILGFIGDIKWITPIGITWLSFLCKIIPTGLIIHNEIYFLTNFHLTLLTMVYGLISLIDHQIYVQFFAYPSYS